MKVKSDADMRKLGEQIGAELKGGEILELVGDVGVGKTTFVKGLARGLEITDDVQSPSFTINRNYRGRDGLMLNHYDFYRLHEPGIMAMEIAESLGESKNITVVEWGASVRDVLPSKRIVVKITYLPDEGREVELEIPKQFNHLSDKIVIKEDI
ncbi:tRNA (adenosine(37)-N6)-threonylcarbamoyltransferase complex ATPase subunit type 1 TsaE [Candidatus Saccharibacteria bacterium]|nr:tRNA (adenosine(37)-N6)-threonylcarbamoyltransferase complex ATPase subunit type 1 TsaE [Candidatus Saccharibacteria bacterium]